MSESESSADIGPMMKMKREPSLHCPAFIGAVFKGSRYQVLRKLGYGVHSMVWLANDRELNRHVALKIAKSNVDSSNQELVVWKHVSAKSRPHPGKKYVMLLLDSFEHYGSTGTHECFVFEVMGHSARSYIKNFSGETAPTDNRPEGPQKNSKVPLSVVKSMLRQVLLGLDFLHKRGVLHNDLHPGNILVSIEGSESTEESKTAQGHGGGAHSINGPDFIRETPGRHCKRERPLDVSELFAHSAKQAKTSYVEGSRNAMPRGGSSSTAGSLSKQMEPALASRKNSHPNPIRIKISDMGAAVLLHNIPDKMSTAWNLRSPEMMLGDSISQSQDMWTFGCLVFELITGRALFMVHSGGHDSSADENSTENEDVVKNGNVLGDQVLSGGHGEDNEQAGAGREDGIEGKKKEQNRAVPCASKRKNSYLQQFACRLGPVPSSILSIWPKSSDFFERDGKPKSGGRKSTPYTSLEDHFDHEETCVEVSPAEKNIIFELIRYIMRYEPEKRPSATQLLRNPWFLNLDGDGH